MAEDGKVAEDGEESLSKKPRLSRIVMDNDVIYNDIDDPLWNPAGLEVVYEYDTNPRPRRSPEPPCPDRGHRPRERCSYNVLGLVPPDECGKYVEMALSTFNDSNRAQKGPEYELVEVLGCTVHRLMGLFHFNFIGRPKNATPNKLFFGEVSYAVGKDGTGRGLICSRCCILGPPGTVTGLGGCEFYCGHKRALIQHPEGGGFIKKLKFRNQYVKPTEED